MAHSHTHTEPADSLGRAFAIGIALNTIYVAVELGVGFSIGSLGLVADAGHNASDVLSLIAAWAGSRLARRPRSHRFTYGLKRSPIVASLFNALLLFGAMGIVAWEAVQRLQNPAGVAGMPIVWVTAVGLVVNFGTALLFVKGRSDLNVRGAFLHMIADGAVTAGVLVAGVAIVLTGLTWLDPAISLAIVAVVLWSTWDLFRSALRLSLDAVPDHIDPVQVERFLCNLGGVVDVHDLHIWAMSTTETAMTAHLVVGRLDERISGLLTEASSGVHEQFSIAHCTLQVESHAHPHPSSACSPETV